MPEANCDEKQGRFGEPPAQEARCRLASGCFGVGEEMCDRTPGGAPLADAESPLYHFLPRRSNPPSANALRLNEAHGG